MRTVTLFGRHGLIVVAVTALAIELAGVTGRSEDIVNSMRALPQPSEGVLSPSSWRPPLAPPP